MERRVFPKPISTAFSLAANTPPNKSLIEQRIFSDPGIPAFFITTNKPFTVIPQKNPSGLVDFKVTGIGIDDAVSEFYADTPVGVSTYMRALKGLRSAIFALKGPRPVGR